MLLHAQQVMPPYGYICDVIWYRLLYYKEILSIYWMTLVQRKLSLLMAKEEDHMKCL